MSYNGHKNHATWLLYVWEFVGYVAEGIAEQADPEQPTPEYCKEQLWEFINEQVPDRDGLLMDLIASVVNDIDWYAISESVSEIMEVRLLVRRLKEMRKELNSN